MATLEQQKKAAENVKSLEQRADALARQLEEMKPVSEQLVAARAYIGELETAVLPIVDTFVPEVEDQETAPLLTRLRQVPQQVQNFVRSAAKVVIKHVLARVQDRWGVQDIEKVADGASDECTDERYEALMDKAEPIAQILVDDLEL